MSDQEWCENIVLPHRPLLRIFSRGTRSFWAAPELFPHLAALEYPNRAIGILLLGICMASERAEPAQPVLTITAGADTKHFTAAELLSRAGLASLEIPPNVDYKFSLAVKAVPLLDLLAAIPLEGFDRLEASATDGFVAQIPLALIEAGKSGGSVAWIAVEDPNHPWPNLPGKNASAGPLYLV